MSIYEAIDKFRESAIQADLSPDGQYIVKGKTINYVTIGKFKRALSPLFNKAGLDFSFNIAEVVDLPTVTRVKVEFILTDVRTGNSDVKIIYADGPNVQAEKGIEIAMSYAMRIYFSNRFMLVDGIEFDNYGETVEDMLDTVAIPESNVVKKPKVPLKEYVKQKTEETPVVESVKTEDAETVEVAVPQEVATPQETEKKKPVTTISDMEKKAANRAMEVIEKAYKDGELVEDTYNQAKIIYDNLSNTQDVGMLLEIKAGLSKTVKEGF